MSVFDHLRNVLSFELILELLPIILSSAGITGTLFAAITAYIIKKAKHDAEIKREERLKLEIMRLEGEEKLSALIFAMVRHISVSPNEKELNETMKAYKEHIENSRNLKNLIITNHTSN